MNELIKINYNDDGQTVSARELHEKLGISKRFSAWWEDQAERLGMSVISYRTSGYTNANNQTFEDYEVPIDIAKHLCMMSGGEKAFMFRDYFIQIERQWNSPEALFARALKMADRKINSLETEKIELKTIIQKQSPKVLFANSVMASSTSILVADLAKIIAKNGVDIGELRLWQWLRNNGYAIKEKGRSFNMPTQKSMDLKVMELKEGTHIDAAGESHIHTTTLVTGKGQVYFANKFLKPVEIMQ
ncbi:MAG: phage antirepressor KilAC domain-containing protein [Candidatus Babeliales bacterium]|jgi:anti-repressor protein